LRRKGRFSTTKRAENVRSGTQFVSGLQRVIGRNLTGQRRAKEGASSYNDDCFFAIYPIYDMQYISTRGDSAAQSASQSVFFQILLGGLAPDGGLYLPAEYPQVSGAELDAWRTLSYADLAYEVLKKFATDIPDADLHALAHKTYTAEVYRNARHGEEAARITPLRLVEEKNGSKLMLQALSNGPTLAFKDMAMQLLGNLFEYTLAKQHAELNIFGATSGDTGSAAEYAMRGKKGIRVFMLSPHQAR
jgi:threonine synthase